MRAIRVMVLGCGFLASHYLPHLLPHSSHIVLIDRERVEKYNYDNHIIPKGYEGRRKVTAQAALLQLLSSIPVTPIHLSIKRMKQLEVLAKEHRPDIAFVSFDNIESRVLARDWAIKSKVPTLFIGVTEDHIYVDWAESVVLPQADDKRVKAVLERIRDVCSRLEFRGLGALAAGVTYTSFVRWLRNGEKVGYMISVTDRISLAELKRS
jgi:hypothetical protein